MEIALITEGTYPFYPGGVSVWCDQLIRGLPQHRFSVHALCGTGNEQATWKAPKNLERVRGIALWGRERRARPRRLTPEFERAHTEFFSTLVRREGSALEFLAALQDLFEYAQAFDLSAALLHNESLRRVSELWMEAQLEQYVVGVPESELALKLSDALAVSDLLAHYLSVLSAKPIRADLTHAVSNGLAGLLGLTSKWAHGTPFLLTEHGVYLRERYLGDAHLPTSHAVRAMILNFFRLLSTVVYKQSDMIVSVADYNRRWQRQNGAPVGRLRSVYNGVESQNFPPTTVDPVVPTISWVGRVDPLKDLETLIRAFFRVREDLPNAQLRLFGPTPNVNEAYRAHLEKLVHGLGLAGAVTFEGPIQPVVGAYHAGHVVALSSVSEGFPYTVIEAMTAGRPVVATDVGGVREAIANTGLVVTPRDPDAFAAACVRLLTNPELRQELGAAARARALEQFTIERFLGLYNALYFELARKGHVARWMFETDLPQAKVA